MRFLFRSEQDLASIWQLKVSSSLNLSLLRDRHALYISVPIVDKAELLTGSHEYEMILQGTAAEKPRNNKVAHPDCSSYLLAVRSNATVYR